jgi:hypothetical protein
MGVPVEPVDARPPTLLGDLFMIRKSGRFANALGPIEPMMARSMS